MILLLLSTVHRQVYALRRILPSVYAPEQHTAVLLLTAAHCFHIHVSTASHSRTHTQHNNNSSLLDTLPEPLWAALCGWFFEYPHNNLFQGVFYKLLLQALRCNSEHALRAAFSRCKLLSSMTEAYTAGDKTCGNRGFIVQVRIEKRNDSNGDF